MVQSAERAFGRSLFNLCLSHTQDGFFAGTTKKGILCQKIDLEQQFWRRLFVDQKGHIARKSDRPDIFDGDHRSLDVSQVRDPHMIFYALLKVRQKRHIIKAFKSSLIALENELGKRQREIKISLPETGGGGKP